jgi:hypothetical protein
MKKRTLQFLLSSLLLFLMQCLWLPAEGKYSPTLEECFQDTVIRSRDKLSAKDSLLVDSILQANRNAAKQKYAEVLAGGLGFLLVYAHPADRISGHSSPPAFILPANLSGPKARCSTPAYVTLGVVVEFLLAVFGAEIVILPLKFGSQLVFFLHKSPADRISVHSTCRSYFPAL